ncbi:MAG: hypothetical protein K9M49_02810 [Candidatus Marinimicrobia bacterium]|nr:hypothetical protein [Candidatus Neomarinimicrobiota bacterium]MCF7904065.1 hypothetical protein [Candidatus Neomarinimicrobiota bacterium]
MLKESELYPPIKEFLEQQGYAVKAEIKQCDVVALRDELILIVELKLSINLTILLQAVDRLKYSDTIYIGVPSNIPLLKRNRKRIVKLMRLLGIGLIVVHPRSKIGKVEVLCDPGEYKPRQIKKRSEQLLGEFFQRQGDPNLGGTATKHGIMTAYRQQALAIAAYLEKHGATKASIIAEAIGVPKTRAILYNNVYGWFERQGKGIYSLSSQGMADIPDWPLLSKTFQN